MKLNLEDSRRLTGANILSDSAGAVIDVSIEGFEPESVVDGWRSNVNRVLHAAGWNGEQTFSRIFPGGASLAFSAPIDALYAATEVNEAAWEATVAALEGRQFSLDELVPGLIDAIAGERNPNLVALRDAAEARGVLFLWDDDFASVGMGCGSLTWETGELPAPEDVPWDRVHDVPAVMVTGSNGKTTTVRLVAAMGNAHGWKVGHTCTDGIFIDGELVEGGDYSGPGGARKMVRDTRVGFAVLETARGGILRRGLGIPRADAALVTNVCDDHLGEWGAQTVEDLIEAKLVIRRAVSGGDFFVNADDDALARQAEQLDQAVSWITTNPGSPDVADRLLSGPAAVVLEDGVCRYRRDETWTDIAPVGDIPITVGGAAMHNVSNVLGAIGLAMAAGVPADAICTALAAFGNNPEDNRGRTNFYLIEGVTVLVDFAHNPHGARALMEMVEKIPAKRRMIMLGQAGDRDDNSIRELTRTMASIMPDLVVVKEMRKYLRGRPEGEVTGIIIDELEGLGLRNENVVLCDSEVEAVRHALDWAEEGDLLILPVLQERDEVAELLEGLRR